STRLFREVHRHFFCERLLLAQDRILATQPAQFLLGGLARSRGAVAFGARLLLVPEAQLLRPDSQLTADLGERDAVRASVGPPAAPLPP
ncbi:MAG: hypothetical protein ABJE10_22355, partial [bacterium]